MHGILIGLMLATGYSLSGYTSSGVPTGVGVAACPPDMAIGTRLLVEGYGYAACLDRYPPWLSRRLDLWFPTDAECRAFTGLHAVTIITDDEGEPLS